MSAYPSAAANDRSSLVTYDDRVPVLVLPSTPSFDDLRTWLVEQLADVVADLSGKAVRLDLGDRAIVLFDVRRLVHLLRDSYQIEVTGLYVQPATLHRYAERELKLKLFLRDPNLPAEAPADPASSSTDEAEDDTVDGPLPGLAELGALLASEAPSVDTTVNGEDAPVEASEEEAAPAAEAAEEEEAEPLPEGDEADKARDALSSAFRRAKSAADLLKDDTPSGRPTQTLYKTVRSGNAIRFDGDVIVLGDVNPGAQITATGDVLVLGRLRGVVHAGAEGDTRAFVLAFELRPSQLRIAHHISLSTRSDHDGFDPVMARVEDEQIVIQPYRGRFRR